MRKLVFVVTLMAALAVASPAQAIHGDPDGNRHPDVGMTFNDDFVCSRHPDRSQGVPHRGSLLRLLEGA
jgi:hypothetical protein